MNNSLSLSFELICLINWLLKHEKETIDKLIQKSIKNGLDKNLLTINLEENNVSGQLEDNKISDELYTTILEFLMFMEESLEDHLYDVAMDSQTEQTILSSLKKLDHASFDEDEIKVHLQQKIEKGDEKNHNQAIKQQLFEQLLDHWKPNSNDSIN